MTPFKKVDHFLMMTIIALLLEVGICVAYWQGLVTVVGLITAHLGIIWVLAINSDNSEQKTKLTGRHKAQIALTTVLGPIGPLLIIVWLGLVWMQSTVAVRLFGTEPIFDTIAASNNVIAAYRQAQKDRAEQLKLADDLLFGDRGQISQALRSLSEHNDGLSNAQIQIHLQGGDTSLSALAALAQKRIDEDSAGTPEEFGELTRDDDATKEQSLERAHKLLRQHAEKRQGGSNTAQNDQEANLASLLDCLFQLGEFEAVRHLLGTEKLAKNQQTDLTKYQAFWRS